MDDDAILEAALRFAASKGDSEPESIECVRDASSMKAVHLFSGGGIYEDQEQPVIAVQVRGSFIGYGARVPSGHRLPTGSVLNFELNAEGHVTGWGIGDRVKDLSQLGDVIRLRPA